MPGNAVIRLRRDTAANWTSANPILALGEPGLETDTRQVKYGDGTTAWNSLAYASHEPSNGDKGDISITGGVWSIDSDVISAYGRTLTSASTAALARGILGLGYFATGTDAANLTGTLPAAVMPALTGDVTSTAGTVATTIANGAVALAKMADMATASLFYRKTAGSGPPEVNTLATLKTDLGLTGTNSGDQTITLTGDVTGSGTGSFAATIGANKVTFSKFVAATAAGIVGATAAGNFGQLTGTQVTALLDTFTSALKGLVPASGGGSTNFLRADGTWAVPPGSGGGSGSITASGYTMTTARLLGRTTAGTGAVEELTNSAAKTFLAIGAADVSGLATVATSGSAADLSTGTLLAARMPALTGDVTSSVGTVATTVGKINGVSLAGLATGILKNTTGTGVPSIAVAGDFPTLNQNTTGSAASLTTSRNFSISGGGITAATVGFNGTAAVVLNASVDAGHITLARMANLAANSIIGNNTGAGATPLALTGTQVTAMLDTFTSALKGLAPASGGGTTNFLRADGTWAAPPGGGGGVSSFNTRTGAVTLTSSDVTTALTFNPNATVADRTALSTLATATASAYLREAGREGVFVWSSANNATNVTNDPNQGVYVPPSSDTTGASGCWVRKFNGFHDVKWFGAKGDSNSTGSTGTDDKAAIQACLTYLGTIGGGTAYFPACFFKCSGYLSLPANVNMRGANRIASTLVFTQVGGGGANAYEDCRNGSGIVLEEALNTSTNTYTLITDICIKNTQSTNVGAAFYNRGATQVVCSFVEFSAFKYGYVNDQGELVDILCCEFGGQVNSGAGVFIVNGGTFNPTASSGFSNRIAIKGCQFNESSTVYGIVDDGGYDHVFEDNNYNGCLNQLRIAGAVAGVRGGEWEGCASHNILMTNLNLAGASVGGNQFSIHGGLFIATSTHSCISGSSSPGTLSVTGCPSFNGGGTTYGIAGAANFAAIWLMSYQNNTGQTSNICDGTAAFVHVDGNLGYHKGGASAIYTITTDNLQLGNSTSVSTASPRILDMGGTYSSTAGANPKLKVYNDGTGVYAFGVSSNSLEVQVPTGAGMDWWIAGTKKATLNATAFSMTGNLAATGTILSTGGAVGYATGAGGSVTQATSRTTGVTINKPTGSIQLFSKTTTAGLVESFTVTNSQVAIGDTVNLSVRTATGIYLCFVTTVAAGSFKVSVYTPAAVGSAEAPIINFAIIKAVNA